MKPTCLLLLMLALTSGCAARCYQCLCYDPKTDAAYYQTFKLDDGDDPPKPNTPCGQPGTIVSYCSQCDDADEDGKCPSFCLDQNAAKPQLPAPDPLFSKEAP